MSPFSLLLGAIVGLGYMLFTGKSKAANTSGGVVQTAQVGNRLYTITRLGGGQYIIVLTSINGQVNQFPVSVMFNQSGVQQEFGEATQLAQLKTDIPQMTGVDFKS